MTLSTHKSPLANLTAAQILALRPGDHSDHDLLEAYRNFKDQPDRARAMAALTLLLRSPQHDSMLGYSEFYHELVWRFTAERDFPAALRWAYAGLAYAQQRAKAPRAGASERRLLAETYVRAGELEAGLGLFIRLLRADPADLWLYNDLGLALLAVGQGPLAAEIFERGLRRIGRRDPDHLKPQFTRLRQEALKLSGAGASFSGGVSPAVLADLRAALALEAGSGSRAQSRYQPPLDQLCDSATPAELVLAAARAQGRRLLPELIELAFDRDLSGGPGPARAISVLRAWRAGGADELDELAAWLEGAEGDWQAGLSVKCGKIGGFTLAQLQSLAADTSYHVYVRGSATEALVERAQRQPARREAIVAFLRRLLTRPEAQEPAEETFVGFLIGDLLDLQDRELYPEIERAFAEDRVDTQIVDLPWVQQRLGLPVQRPPEWRRDGLYLPLRCTACQRERTHFVRLVLLDVNTMERVGAGQAARYSPYIMDHEIVCPKCGAVDCYEMTPAAHLRLFGPKDFAGMLALTTNQKPAEPAKLPKELRAFRSSVFGQPMHPLDGLDEYRRRLAVAPNDARLHLKCANLLRTVLRAQAALTEYRRAYALAADSEIILACAMAEHDFGDREKAGKLYAQVLHRELQGPWGVTPGESWAGLALAGQARLKRGQSSPAHEADDPPLNQAAASADFQPGRAARPASGALAAAPGQRRRRRR